MEKGKGDREQELWQASGLRGAVEASVMSCFCMNYLLKQGL